MAGLSPSQIKALNNLYHRRCPQAEIISNELARTLAEISRQIGRQVAILLTRKGEIAFVIVGTHHQVMLPALDAYRSASVRFKGLRLIHTHLNDEGLTEDDLTDLALLRLDYICALTTKTNGLIGAVHGAHLLPCNDANAYWEQIKVGSLAELNINFPVFITELETEFVKKAPAHRVDSAERAILIGVFPASGREDAQESLAELKELAISCGVAVYDSVLQTRHQPDPKFLLGKGKLADLLIRALQIGVNLLIFDGELTPAQTRSITDFVQIKIIDRTQVILDIFARRAHSREGKLQVELAQLKYMLPRLRLKDTAMSRLTGGIGARGPGETKLEINRRRVHERIGRLEKELKTVQRSRSERLSLRQRRGLPVISIVGYTNAGKSTLLNTLTKSTVFAEDMVFATLDTKSARLRLPYDQDVIITDTVGFIRNLPAELLSAFRATLEELHEADVLLHIVDASNGGFEKQMEAVEKVLSYLGVASKPTLRVFNKIDKMGEEIGTLCRRFDAIPVCALQPPTLDKLLTALAKITARREGADTNLP